MHLYTTGTYCSMRQYYLHAQNQQIPCISQSMIPTNFIQRFGQIGFPLQLFHKTQNNNEQSTSLFTEYLVFCRLFPPFLYKFDGAAHSFKHLFVCFSRNHLPMNNKYMVKFTVFLKQIVKSS